MHVLRCMLNLHSQRSWCLWLCMKVVLLILSPPEGWGLQQPHLQQLILKQEL